MKRPILIGTPETLSLIPENIQRMLDVEGLYIGSNPHDPAMGEAPLVSMGGKIYSLVIDNELDPTRFIEGHQIDGPFRAMINTPSLIPEGFPDDLPPGDYFIQDLLTACGIETTKSNMIQFAKRALPLFRGGMSKGRRLETVENVRRVIFRIHEPEKKD